MTTSPKSTGVQVLAGGKASEAKETVPVTPTLRLPRRFSESFITDLGDGRIARTVVHVLMSDDGRPLLDRFEFLPPSGGLRVDELRRPDLKALVQWAYQRRIGRQLLMARLESEGVHGEGWSYLEMSDDEFNDLARQSGALSRPRGAYRLTEQFLVEVVATYKEGGVDLVTKQNDVSERTARRWLKEARERGLL